MTENLSEDERAFLTRAIALAAEARAEGDHPFGAVLVVDGVVVAEAKNRVNTNHDITAHAESMLVRNLETEGRLELLKSGVMYASCEPCPMCVGAMFWSGSHRAVFGLSSARLNEIATAPGQELFGFTVSARSSPNQPHRACTSTAPTWKLMPKFRTTASGRRCRHAGRVTTDSANAARVQLGLCAWATVNQLIARGPFT